jgi:hypothetical protein
MGKHFETEGLSAPAFRATMEGARLTLVPARWVTLGARAVREALSRGTRPGVAVVDLCVDQKAGWRELVVRPLTGLDPQAEKVLLRWAAAVGYRRTWLPGRVIELADGPPEVQTATVTCPTCGALWRDEAPDFWADVWSYGGFPSRCQLCGGLMPQWKVEPLAPEAEEDVMIQRRWVKGDGES